MRAKKNNDGSITYHYKAETLEYEVVKSEKELVKIEKIIPFLEFSYNEAKKAYESKERRISELKDFIQLAKSKIKEGENE